MIEQVENLQQLRDDIILFHTFVHGTENDTVILGGVPTPSLRNFVKTIRANAQSLLDQAAAFEEHLAKFEEQTSAIQEEFVDGNVPYRAHVLLGLSPVSDADQN